MRSYLRYVACLALGVLAIITQILTLDISVSSAYDWPLLHHDERNTSCSNHVAPKYVEKSWEKSDFHSQEFFSILEVSAPLIVRGKVVISVYGLAGDFVVENIKDIASGFPDSFGQVFEAIGREPAISRIYILNSVTGEVVKNDIPPLPGRLTLAADHQRLFVAMEGVQQHHT